MKTTWLKTALAVAVGALSSQAMAAGFALNEQSISGMGTSFAGRSSSADDATTLFGNPAGMSASSVKKSASAWRRSMRRRRSRTLPLRLRK